MNTYAELANLYLQTTHGTDLAHSALPDAPQQPVTAPRFDVRGWWRRRRRAATDVTNTVAVAAPARSSAPASLPSGCRAEGDAADDRRPGRRESDDGVERVLAA